MTGDSDGPGATVTITRADPGLMTEHPVTSAAAAAPWPTVTSDVTATVKDQGLVPRAARRGVSAAVTVTVVGPGPSRASHLEPWVVLYNTLAGPGVTSHLGYIAPSKCYNTSMSVPVLHDRDML